MNQLSGKFDLEDRTAEFGQKTIRFCRLIRQDAITRPLISQLVRSATSIGANYSEANGASSQKDFANKIYICRKEAQETRHWLKMISEAHRDSEEELRELQEECRQLILIFQKISSTLAAKKIQELKIN